MRQKAKTIPLSGIQRRPSGGSMQEQQKATTMGKPRFSRPSMKEELSQDILDRALGPEKPVH